MSRVIAARPSTSSFLTASLPIARALAFAVGALTIGASVCACELGDPDKDRTPPRVIAVSPADPIVPVTTRFAVTFSEPLDASTVDADPRSETLTVVLAPRDVVTDAFISDLNNPPLIESRQDDVVVIDVEVSARNTVLEVDPGRLQANTAYVLLLGSNLRDPAQNPLVDAVGIKATFRYDFTTDAGPPEVRSTDIGTGLVAPNRRRFTVTFNQPVRELPASALSFSPAVEVEAILLDQARSSATVLVADQAGCERFRPDTDYQLDLGADVVADTGQPLIPFQATFRTGAACDTVAHRVVGVVDGIAGETTATIRFETNKASTTLVRFGENDGGPLDCLGLPCPVVGASARTANPGSTPPTFLHAVELTGLTVGDSYRAVVSAEDDVGQVTSSQVVFETAPLPKIAVNEVMGNPAASIGSENDGEYIELTNFGDVDVDVSGWRVQVKKLSDGSVCNATISADSVLAPGAFLLVTRASFNAAAYEVESNVLLSKTSTCGLLNSEAQGVVLVDPSGRPVSSYAGYASTIANKDGRSVERVAPAAADLEANFCYSRTDTGPSPGRQNGVLVAGCEN